MLPPRPPSPPSGAAGRHVLLPVEGHGAVTPVPGLYLDLGNVDKHTRAAPFPFPAKRASPGWGPKKLSCPVFRDLLTASAYTLTFLRSAPMRSNFTLPSTRANRVSSEPRPTLAPGWILVPRCLTRMLPASTNCPSEPLDAQALGLGITAVLGGAHALLMGEKLDVDLQHSDLFLSGSLLHFQIPDFHVVGVLFLQTR